LWLQLLVAINQESGASPFKILLRNGEAQICMRLPKTTQRAHHPRRFEEQYKTAGIAP